MQDNPPARFLLRLLAKLTDDSLLFLPHAFFLYFIAGSAGLSQAFYRLILYLILLALPSVVLVILYYAYLTGKKGGTIGKLVTGLKVTDTQGSLLPWKMSLFRHTVGYAFSSLLFGLGYLSVIKDGQKQAWHDKTVGSKVTVTQNRWPIALGLLTITVFLNIWLIIMTIDRTFNGHLANDFEYLLNTSKQAPQVKEDQQSPSKLLPESNFD